MKTRFLFPHYMKVPGLFLSLICLALGIAHIHFQVELPIVLPIETKQELFGLVGGKGNNMTDEIAGIGLITGLMLLAFSKEKLEDEYIAQLRLESLQWAVYINYLLLAIAFLLVYNFQFLNIIIYNMFTVLLIFIIRFNFLLYRYNHSPEIQPA